VKKKLTRDRFAAEIVRRLRTAGEKADLTVDRSAFCVVRDGQPCLYLHNAYDEYRAAPTHLRETTLRRWTQGWFACHEHPPEIYEQARCDLLPIVRSRATNGLEHDAHRLLSEHHVIKLVHNRPLTMMHLKAEMLSKWGVTLEEALAVAVENLRAVSFPPRFVPQGKGLFSSDYGDHYDASRVLLPELFAALELRGDPVVIVPNEYGPLLVAGADDEEGLVAMAHLAFDRVQGPRFLSGIPLRSNGTNWDAFCPPPGNPAFVPFRNLWCVSMSRGYARQKEALDEQHRREGQDVLVADYMAIPLPEYREITSGCVWPEGAATLLPRSDTIGLLPCGVVEALMKGTAITEDAGIVAHWEQVEEVMGDMLVPVAVYPPRYRVDRFPAPDQLDALRRRLETGPNPESAPAGHELRRPR
jgi:hypothetical protein